MLKPSELSPLSALLFAQIMHDAGTPPGVFNLVNGTGEEVGAAIAAHPDVDMVSITGSVRAGVLVAQTAAATVKRVDQELGGKSPNILLPDADFEKAVPLGIASAFRNVGQSCSAPTRMIVPATGWTRWRHWPSAMSRRSSLAIHRILGPFLGRSRTRRSSTGCGR